VSHWRVRHESLDLWVFNGGERATVGQNARTDGRDVRMIGANGFRNIVPTTVSTKKCYAARDDDAHIAGVPSGKPDRPT